MTTTNMKATSMLALVAMVSFVSLTLAMSIEREPVRVTPQNSGPKYDVDEDKLTPTNPESEQQTINKEQIDNNRPTGVRVFGGNPPTGDQQDPQEAFPIGHMTIRRIFLVPMMSPPRQEGDQPEPAGPNSDMPLEQPSPMFPRPLWPFSLSPARHQQPHRHLFGQDEASRPPVDPKEREDPSDNSPAASGEREGERGPPERPMFDPIKMMIDMMQQAIAGQLAPPETSNPGDLNTNEASDKPTSERDSRKPTSAAGAGELDKPMRPTNETKEDIVEIDGKKYLRKTIINRHVGENIIFMTKRLIFTQLNDTDANETPIKISTTTTTTLKPTDEATEIPVKPTATPAEEPTRTTSTTPADVPATEEPAVRTEQPTEMSTTTTSTTSEAPVSTSAGDQIASSSTTTTTTTTEQPEETTTTKDAAEAAKKAAERLTGSTITTN